MADPESISVVDVQRLWMDADLVEDVEPADGEDEAQTCFLPSLKLTSSAQVAECGVFPCYTLIIHFKTLILYCRTGPLCVWLYHVVCAGRGGGLDGCFMLNVDL